MKRRARRRVRPGKRSVSVSAATFARAKEYALDNDVAMTWIVDEAVAPVLGASTAATFAAVPAARRPARRSPAPPVIDPPIPFWLLPTGPTRK